MFNPYHIPLLFYLELYSNNGTLPFLNLLNIPHLYITHPVIYLLIKLTLILSLILLSFLLPMVCLTLISFNPLFGIVSSLMKLTISEILKIKPSASALNIPSPIKWLVTGTPIQNRRQDFYSLCRIIGIPETFYIDPNNAPNIAKLFILKRTKKQVGIQLPPLQQNTIPINWKSEAERELSEDIHHHLSFSNSSGSGILSSIDYSSPFTLPYLC